VYQITSHQFMAKIPSNHKKPITKDVIKEVKELAKENTPTRVIGIKIGRTEDSVRSIASENGISLKPTNQSPYGTKDKKN
jgi:tartrate dehydratase alpha subunit/fumarate hydratase class I-like protein